MPIPTVGRFDDRSRGAAASALARHRSPILPAVHRPHGAANEASPPTAEEALQ